MRERLRFLLIYFVFWVIFFLCARFLFLTYHINDTKSLTLELLFGVFRYGIVMDMSMAGYFCILPFLWVTFSNFINKSVFQNTIFSYTFILVTISNFLIIADMEVYNIWNFRIDGTPLKFLTSPRQAYISVSNSPILRLLLSYVILVAVAGIIVYRFIANKIYDWKHIANFPFIFYGLLATAALTFPIRGGFNSRPLKPGYVYFSDNNFANAASLNAPWNFIYSLAKKTSVNENPYAYLPKENLENAISYLFSNGGQIRKVIGPVSKPNVLIILLENFTSKVVDLKFDSLEVSPYFNKLKNQGIYFENIYASADRTDKSVLSVLSGYPAQPQESVLEFPEKVEKLPVLSKNFYNNGYSTQFYFGGDAGFLGLKNYLFGANFEKILEGGDFSNQTDVLGLGVADEYVYAKFLEEHKGNQKKPFFATILTLSGHEPFEVPGERVFKADTETALFLNALHYSDAELGKFLEKAKTEKWWGNTLVIVIGNDGNKLPQTTDKTENFRIPMLWTGGVVNQNLKFKQPFSQNDLAYSLLNQIGISGKEYKWSKNIFSSKVKPWAFYVFNDGFAFIDSKEKILYDNIGRKQIDQPEQKKSKALEQGKALMQRTYQDFLDL